MLFSIGGLIFNSITGTGFNTITKTKKGEYAEQALIDGAMSIKKGRGLDTLVLQAQWIGLESTSRVSDLNKLLTGYHQMSDQDGNNMGQWTADSYTDNGSDTFGRVQVCHNVTLNLREYR